MTYRIAAALLLLTACSPHNEQPPAPKLFEQQRDALDQAKTVEAIQQQQAAEQRKTIEQQSQ